MIQYVIISNVLHVHCVIMYKNSYPENETTTITNDCMDIIHLCIVRTLMTSTCTCVCAE